MVKICKHVALSCQVQWGIPAKPSEASKWRNNKIKDDPVIKSNERGTISFATSGKDSRTTQVQCDDNPLVSALNSSRF
jgi:hypothetical protein